MVYHLSLRQPTDSDTVGLEVLVIEQLDRTYVQIDLAPEECGYLIVHIQLIQSNAFGSPGPDEIDCTTGVREVCKISWHTWKVVHERKDGPDWQIECNPTGTVKQVLTHPMAFLLFVTVADAEFPIFTGPIAIFVQANVAVIKTGCLLRRRRQPGKEVHLFLRRSHLVG
jgi:hypothetical protein